MLEQQGGPLCRCADRPRKLRPVARVLASQRGVGVPGWASAPRVTTRSLGSVPGTVTSQPSAAHTQGVKPSLKVRQAFSRCSCD